MPADRPGAAVDRLATLEADLRDHADRLLAEREERLAAEPATTAPKPPAAVPEPPATAAPADSAAPAVAAPERPASRRRLSGALLLAIFLAPAVIAGVAALLFAGENGDDDGPRRDTGRSAAPAPRKAAALRLSADGAATARALRARGVFGVEQTAREEALEGLCAGAADVAVLRSVPRGSERAPAAGCEVDVVAQVPVAVTRVVAPLGGCLGVGRARGRAASPGALDAARRRAARRAGPRARRKLTRDAPVRGRDATVRRRVARQASSAATVAFDARRRLLPVAVRAAGGRPCIDPRAAAIAAGTYPLTRRLVLTATASRATTPALRLAARLRAATARTRVRTVATFRAPTERQLLPGA